MELIEELTKKIFTKSLLKQFLKPVSTEVKFEEIPIISKYKEIDFLKDYISTSDYSAFLLNISLFVLYNIKLQFKNSMNKKDYDEYFACITLCDPIDEMNDVGFTIPNIFISSKTIIKYLSNETMISLKEDKFLEITYGSIIDENLFHIHKIFEKDKYGSIDRFYIVPKSW